ncbi:MAG TPA: 3'-5' exonuclease, partial [Acetobacteraceae bacterium]|nr:3'-5' exonuclease [Acetobacteraceae bacterium]
KQRAGALDFDDLIEHAQRILEDPGYAWILYKLDGGLDHVLLDEAQDSNPGQWGIVRALTAEFFAGLGANQKPRSVFAVGDAKQAIYAFQGADPAGFVRARDHYARAVTEARQAFHATPLDVSFRSTEPVLALVDAVFAEGSARAGVVEDGQVLRHLPSRAGQAGSVELWPVALGQDPAPAPPWAPPETPVEGTGAAQRLAAALAARIAHMIAHERLPARVERQREAEQREGRPVRPGDILVLLRARERGGFAASLVRALKERGVPVGGMDRLALVEQIAVQDLLALAEVLLLPEDDLALAAVLKSPLIGLDEEELFGLAQGRSGSLWAELARHRSAESRLGKAADWLASLMDRADLLPPHALFAAVLGGEGPLDPRRGRARMLARLGHDAADPLDEFLNAALAMERKEPPSLQLFVHRMRQGEAEVKREAEGGGDAVRIMTVHGAKGLQAPVVILPDTMKPPEGRDTIRWIEDGDGHALPIWIPRKDPVEPDLVARQRAADGLRGVQEENRLLYVALTRAQDRLIVCGWARGKRPPAADCWYEQVKAGFARLEGARQGALDAAGFGADPDIFGADAAMWHFARPQAPGAAQESDPPATVAVGAATLPPWVNEPVPAETVAAAAAPSAMAGEEETPAANPGRAADPLGRRFRRGRLVHALLQHLPEHPPARWAEMAERFLARHAATAEEAERRETLEEVLRLLAEPALAEALGPGSLAEAPLTGRIGEVLIAGQVDRLLVRPDRVLVLDYKTNRPPPPVPDAVPPLYLRQMAAYRAVLREAFPGREVACALVWTYGARFMRLSDALLDRHAPRGSA